MSVTIVACAEGRSALAPVVEALEADLAAQRAAARVRLVDESVDG